MVWNTLSKAAERSRRVKILMWPESAVMRRPMVIFMTTVSVLWCALKPDWRGL